MTRARFFAGRSPFAAVPVILACGCSAPAETAAVMKEGAGADPARCLVDGAFQDVRAVAFDGRGGMIVATGPDYRRPGETVVHKLDVDCRPVWAYRPARGDMLWIAELAIDADGNVVIAGSQSSVAEQDRDRRSVGAMTILTLDPEGRLLWSDVTGWVGTFSLLRLTPAGSVVVRGRAYNDGEKWDVLSQRDGAGRPIWARVFPGEGMRIVDLGVDDAGDVFVAGQFGFPLDFGGGTVTPAHDAEDVDTHDVFLVKYDATGRLAWMKRLGDHHHQSAQRLCVDAQGNATIEGRGRGTFDLGGGVVTVTGEFSARFDSMGRWVCSDPGPEIGEVGSR